MTRHSNISLYDLISHSSSKSHLAYVDATLNYFEGMVDHSTTLIRDYSGALIYYLVLLELDHVPHTTSTIFDKAKVAKVDLTASVQRVQLYQHVQQFVQLSPIWLSQLTSAHQVFNPL